MQIIDPDLDDSHQQETNPSLDPSYLVNPDSAPNDDPEQVEDIMAVSPEQGAIFLTPTS